FKFDYIIGEGLQSFVEVGVGVIVAFGGRRMEGYVMSIESEGDEGIDMSKVKEIKEIEDIKGELRRELIEVSEWVSEYHL
ncbi:primosomal protein N' family DNA-binding protein, partial [Staphylococcus warneri]|uniref:primosomal protein N' family DNA-binding protein n=1 Tax=Staphylococcus warneri TaxID=1292 RepID=UPI001642DE51